MIEPAGVACAGRIDVESAGDAESAGATDAGSAGAIGAANGDGAAGSDRFSEKSTPPSAAPHAQRASSGAFSRSQTGQTRT